MKKRFFISLILCAALLMGFSCLAFADGSAHVGDAAGLLTQTQYLELERKCAAVSDKYGCGIYIVAVQDFRQFGSSVSAAAEAIFDGTGMGYGSDSNGILLLLSMDDRDYDILAHGDLANTAFTDYGKDLLADSFLGDFGNDDWFGGFDAYVGSCDYFLECAQKGAPIDEARATASSSSLMDKLPFIVLIPCAVSGLACAVAKSSMKTARRKTEAHDYLRSRSVNLSVREDIFTHRTQSVQHIERNPRPASGGGTSVNSGGFSHKSGKF